MNLRVCAYLETGNTFMAVLNSTFIIFDADDNPRMLSSGTDGIGECSSNVEQSIARTGNLFSLHCPLFVQTGANVHIHGSQVTRGASGQPDVLALEVPEAERPLCQRLAQPVQVNAVRSTDHIRNFSIAPHTSNKTQLCRYN
ncbi:hypothetical protein LOZ58_006305 [Ophidiomyces ophidiicola]|nr:hypothetical protein LOZ58_006305 [Ophidiomyces ophidiicola]